MYEFAWRVCRSFSLLLMEAGLLLLHFRLIGVHCITASHILSIGGWVLRFYVVG